PATDCNASPETCPPGGRSPGSLPPSRPASCPRLCEHVTVTSSAPSSSKTGPSRLDAEDSSPTTLRRRPAPLRRSRSVQHTLFDCHLVILLNTRDGDRV